MSRNHDWQPAALLSVNRFAQNHILGGRPRPFCCNRYTISTAALENLLGAKLTTAFKSTRAHDRLKYFWSIFAFPECYEYPSIPFDGF
jgi:hypothetical protein